MQRKDDIYDGLDTSDLDEIAEMKRDLQKTNSHLRQRLEEAKTTKKILKSLGFTARLEEKHSYSDEDSSSEKDDISPEEQKALIDKYRRVQKESSQLEAEGKKLFTGVTQAELDKFLHSIPRKK